MLDVGVMLGVLVVVWVCSAVVSLNAANRFPVYVRDHDVSVGTNFA